MASILRTTRGLLALGLLAGAASTQAAFGIAVSRDQENAVEVGMSATEVEQVLGRPAANIKYPRAAGPSWTYHVAGAPYGTTEFTVDFGPDGKVVAAREFWVPSGG